MRRDARAGRALQLAAVLGTALALAACEPNVTTPADASARVRDSYAWMGDAELCPADVMPAGMRMNGLKGMSCAGAELPGCFRRCRKGDVDSCYWLANALDRPDSTDAAVQALYQRACMLGEPSGCTNRAAGMFRADRRSVGVQACAARTFERTCALHDAWGCTMLGNALHEGLGVPRDDARALDVLGIACQGVDGDDPACGAARQISDLIRESRADAPASN